MKSYAFTEKYEINLRNINASKRKERISRNQSRNSEMSTKTRDFIQKICYRKTASVDMTRYGFICDSKLHPVNLLLKPLRAQLEKICGKPTKNASVRRNSPVRRKVKAGPRMSSPRTPRPFASPPSSPSRYPTSILSSPGSRSSRIRKPIRKIEISSPSPSNLPVKIKKNVRLVLPTTRKKK